MSHAVTQGGSALLIKALQDAGERRWFTVLDRARLDDTLKERQIVTEMRRIYRGETEISPEALPPLQHAGIILQGGITGYDIYTKTGGIGARYLGIGGDTKWQQDTVTINLRAVSTSTSEVLASVTVQKSIASISAQGGIFRYVALDKILEAEAGVTANEPKQVAVEQAIEKAVDSLILEGAHIGVWKFAQPAAGKPLVEAYLLEKYDGAVPAAALAAVPPATRNAASVVPTVPLPRQSPPPAPTPTPPPPDTPPPPNADEVVG
jgi:curli production assembly/transport component CsgG